MSKNIKQEVVTSDGLRIAGPIAPNKLEIGSGFEALSFREADFDTMMDPLIMVDNFTMSEPTFGAHPHAGISAVTVLLEDTEGEFLNRDSLGKRIQLKAGDVYWLVAAKGAVHDEAPLAGSKVHGLQIFVNLPSKMKQDDPHSVHLKAEDIPVIEDDTRRIRVVLGGADGVQGPSSPVLPFTLLDGQLKAGGQYVRNIPAKDAVWLHTLKGNVSLSTDGYAREIQAGSAIALRNSDVERELVLKADEDAQFVLISASPLLEPFVKEGPFVMNSAEEIRQLEEDYKKGLLGKIAE